MSFASFYSLNQVIVWLQQLSEKQKKGKFNSAFDIKKQLCYEVMPPYQELISSDKSLCHYASKLFGASVDNIQLAKKRLASREYCWEVTFVIENQEQVFFIKHAWEGAIKEAIGLEFNNLLTDTPIRYLCGAEIIITEKIFEALPTDTLYELRESHSYIFAYGAWEIYTKLLRLTDRKTSNVRWNGERLANIDFGLVFYKGEPVFDSRFTLTEPSELRRQGQRFALKYLLEQFARHQEKLENLLLNTDVHFCRALLCSRTPREPLKVMLAALKELNTEIGRTVFLEQTKRKSPPVSVLAPLLNMSELLYLALVTEEGVILEEIKSPEYQQYDELASNMPDLHYPLLNQHLLNLIIAVKNNAIFNTESQSMQIDLTIGRLLVIWNKDNGVIALSLLKPDASVAHIKANMRKLLENFAD